MFSRSTKKTVATALTALLIAGCGAQYDYDVDLEGKAEQTHWGEYEYQPFIDAGWSGYLIQATITKDEASYEYDDGYYVINPRCTGGDCPFAEEVVFKALGGGHGKRLESAVPLGKAKLRDAGDVDTTEVTMANGAPIALITENQVQSAAKFDEQQTAVFTGFRGDGELAEDLGHIEEMDAPMTITQPESVYRRLPDGTDEFVTTVIERVAFTNKKNNSEYARESTRWCQSDKWKATDNFLEKVKKDSFDLDECNADTQPMTSTVIKSGKQWWTGRSTSDVTLWNPSTGDRNALSYRSGSDVTMWNGTRYYLEHEGTNLIWTNSELYATKSNTPKGDLWGESNYPKAKLVHINWDKERKYKGVSKDKYWTQENPDAFALVLHEKLNEVHVDMDGQVCTSKGWRESSKKYALRCGLATRFTLNMLLLFPPTINGQEWSMAQKTATLDRYLAAIPDQTQQSPELTAAEKYLDFIIALERVQASGKPDVITFENLVDMGTEEDHLTAQNKVWDLFTDLGVVPEREGRTKDTFEIAVEETTTSGSDDKPLF